MKKLTAMIIGVVLAVAISGCETMKGAGKDIQKAGESIEKAAD